MEHTEWLDTTTGGATPRAIDAATGISYRTIQEQAKRNKISAENVIRIAEAYEAHPVAALVATDYLDEKWLTVADIPTALRAATEHQLADAVLERMLAGPKTNALLTPVDELVARGEYAADDSDTEPEPGDDDYHDGP